MNATLQCIPFNRSDHGTLGVEMEWFCVDRQSGRQMPFALDILAAIDETPRIKPELFTSIIEINTDIHRSTQAAMDQLRSLYDRIDSLLIAHSGALLASSTHPFSHWRDQQISDDPRYARLLKRLCWVARRFNICGIHAHIGMPDGDICINTMNQLLPIMPVFLAISANSPFWHGERTGLMSSRIKVFEGLSQGGMPFYFQDWSDFEHCVSRLMSTGSIDSVRDIWWEMRPHPDFGTLEIRIGDMPATFADTAAYIAYVRAEAMAATAASGVKVHPSLIRENRWRACRYGMQAVIIDPQTEQPVPLLDWLELRLDHLAACGIAAEELALVRERLQDWSAAGGGADRQIRQFRSENDFAALVSTMREQDEWRN